jgi:hypothetical protein
MAAKKRATKPKGIVDDIAKGIQSLVSATQPKITDPQSLAEFKQTTKNILKTGATVGDAVLTGGLGGSLGKNVIAPGAMVASPKTRSQAQNSGLGKFGVDVGVTAATAGAAVGVAKGVASALNRIKASQSYVVHGGPAKLVGGKVDPKFVRDAPNSNVNNTLQLNKNVVQGQKDIVAKYTKELAKPFPQFPSQTSQGFVASQAKSKATVQKSMDWLKAEKKAGGFFSAAYPDSIADAAGYAVRDAGQNRNTGKGALHILKVNNKQITSQPDGLAVAAKAKPIVSIPIQPKGPGLDWDAVAKANNVIAQKQAPVKSNPITAIVSGVSASATAKQKPKPKARRNVR